MSSLSAEWWKKQSFEDRHISLLLFSLYLLFSLSFFAMAQGSLIPTAIGFLLLSSLKTIYRPFLGALVLGFIKDSGSKATRLSAYTLLSSIGMALTSFLYADKFAGFDSINLTIAAALLPLGVLLSFCSYYYRASEREVFPDETFSTKRHFIKKNYSTCSFVQEYESESHINSYIQRGRIDCYPAPSLLLVSGRRVEWEYIGGTPLSFLEEKEQLPVLESFREIFSEKTKAPPREIMIHGDLHPHNILVQKGRFYCIDWDLAKTGPLEIDILTLFTSPFLKISPPRRTHLVKDAGNYPFPLAEQKIKDFLNYKVKQLEFLPEGPFKGRLITAYKEVQRACDC